jgi:hypothetical protein
MAAKTPKCARTLEQRTNLGGLIRNLVWAGIESKGECETWWQQCEAYHRNQPAANEEDESLVPLHIPFSQPRQDQLTAQCCTVITKQEPYMLAECPGDEMVEETLEKAVDKFWRSAGFEKQIRRASRICTDTNLVWYRCAWTYNPRKVYGGIILDVIHPKHVSIYPATMHGIDGARLVGHLFMRRLRDVHALQDEGIYFNDVKVAAGSSIENYDTTGQIANSGASPSVAGPDPMDLQVPLYDVLFKYGERNDDGTYEPERWYHATIAFEQSALLAFEEYPYSRPWYFDAQYIIGSEDGYWPGESVGRHLSFLQDAINKLHTGNYNGAMMSSYPPVFGPQLPEKDFRYGYGDYVPSDFPANSFYSPNIRFDGRPMLNQIEMFNEIGDSTSRISANATGSISESDQTATETSVIAAGVATGLEEYIGNFTANLGDMAAFTIELLAFHFSEWSQKWGPVLGIQTAQQLEVPALWECNGKTPGNTPGARLNGIEKLMQMASAFGPQTGIDPYELTKLAIANLNLQGGDNIQISRENLAQQQQSQPGPGQPPAGPALEQPNGPSTPGLPQPSGMASPANVPAQSPLSSVQALLQNLGPGSESGGIVPPPGGNPVH